MGAVFDPNFWKNLTDEDLKKQKFEVRSSDSLPPHIEKIPSGVSISNIVFKYYDLSDKQKCVGCEKKLHRNGAVIALSNGDMALIGSKCGPAYFGLPEWNEANSAFSRGKNRSEGLVWAENFILNFDNIKRDLLSIRSLFFQFETKQKSISDFLGNSNYIKIRNICVRNAGNLAYDQRIRSPERIAAMSVAKVRPSEDGNYYEMVSLGRLSGVTIFSLSSTASKIQNLIDEAVSLFCGLKKDDVPTTKLTRGKKWYSDAKLFLEEALESIQDAIQFVSDKNLKLLHQWDERQSVPVGIFYNSGILTVGSGSNERKIAPNLFDELRLPLMSPTKKWP